MKYLLFCRRSTKAWAFWDIAVGVSWCSGTGVLGAVDAILFSELVYSVLYRELGCGNSR